MELMRVDPVSVRGVRWRSFSMSQVKSVIAGAGFVAGESRRCADTKKDR